MPNATLKKTSKYVNKRTWKIKYKKYKEVIRTQELTLGTIDNSLVHPLDGRTE
jgi:DNA repair protein RadC